MQIRQLFAALLLSLLAPFAAAEAALHVEAAWARATAPGATNGAAYFRVVNGGSADRLLSARAGVSARVELHTHTMRGGMMQMHAVPAVEIPAGGRVEFAPGGLHVMLIGLGAPLTDGAVVPLTLEFERAGALRIDVPVRREAPAGSAPAAQHRH